MFHLEILKSFSISSDATNPCKDKVYYFKIFKEKKIIWGGVSTSLESSQKVIIDELQIKIYKHSQH